LKILPHLSFTKGGDHDFPLRKRGAVKKLEYAPLTLTLSLQGRGEAIHPPSRAGGYSGIFL
jgi:hypothetical protein